MRTATGKAPEPRAAQATKHASVLNLGSGARPIPGAVNLDITPTHRPDIVHDLRQLPWPFEASLFDKVVAHDILEHLPDLPLVMDEIARVSRTGAVIEITTPHFSCANSYTDPTHCQRLGFFSFDFFTAPEPSERYTTARFRCKHRSIVFSSSAKNLGIRRFARRWPAAYENHLCWLMPAWFLYVELVLE